MFNSRHWRGRTVEVSNGKGDPHREENPGGMPPGFLGLAQGQMSESSFLEAFIPNECGSLQAKRSRRRTGLA